MIAGWHGGLGDLKGDHKLEVLDYVYFSSMTYTTVGYGDLFPSGPLRFIAAMEALLGLMLITWSASFTYLELQRFGSGRESQAAAPRAMTDRIAKRRVNAELQDITETEI